MVYELIVKKPAENDLKEALEWYSVRGLHLSHKLLNEIDNCLTSIKKNPEKFQKRYKQIRIVFTQIFPFGIYYTVDKNSVIVHAILHTKMNSGRGIERLK